MSSAAGVTTADNRRTGIKACNARRRAKRSTEVSLRGLPVRRRRDGTSATLCDLEDALDLHRDPEWQSAHANRRARVLAALGPKRLDEQL